jgi:hypothetical protein
LSSGVKREVHRNGFIKKLGDSVPEPLEFIALVFQGDEKGGGNNSVALPKLICRSGRSPT